MKKIANLQQKFDLLTGEELEYKNPEQYSLQNFKDKRNMKKYFAQAKEENKLRELGKLIKNTFSDYVKLKRFEYAPSQTDLKSIKYLPNILSINEYYLTGYDGLINDLKLKSRFDYGAQVNLPELPSDLKIIIDSREQRGFVLDKKISTEIKGLPFGDYTIEREEQRVFIERKSQGDAIGTLGTGYDRFYREIERAQKADKYIVVLVEQSFSNFSSFNYQPGYFGKATPAYIFRNMRKLCQSFPRHIQFLFADGKKEAAKLVPYILLMNQDVIDIDLEFYYNKGLIKT